LVKCSFLALLAKKYLAKYVEPIKPVSVQKTGAKKGRNDQKCRAERRPPICYGRSKAHGLPSVAEPDLLTPFWFFPYRLYDRMVSFSWDYSM